MSKEGINGIEDLLSKNTYPGRGIIIGNSTDGKKAMIAYFIMGRSENSRNRVFERFDGGLRTKAYDESKMQDPSLIIYNPYRSLNGYDIITNGDQTDTVYAEMTGGAYDEFAFEKALNTREFEPDKPNYTPRISALVSYRNGFFDYKLSILKSNAGAALTCDRFFYGYTPKAGLGHFIHTYECDGDPLPSFCGEPKRVMMPNTAEAFAETVWNSLNGDNKVSLFVRAVPLNNDAPTEIIINKNEA